MNCVFIVCLLKSILCVHIVRAYRQSSKWTCYYMVIMTILLHWTHDFPKLVYFGLSCSFYSFYAL